MYCFPDQLRGRGPTISIAILLNEISIIRSGMSGAGCIRPLSDYNNSIEVALDKEGYIYIANLVSTNNSRILWY